MDEVTAFRLFLIQEQHGKKRKRSARTTQLYLELLSRLRKHVPDLSPDKILFHLLSLSEQGRKGSYLNDYVDLLHVYGRFLQTDKYDVIKYFPEETFEKATMSDEEIEKFLSLPPVQTTRYDPRTKTNKSYVIGEKQYRIKTLFWKILAYSGMRPGEVAHLTVDSVDFGRGIFIADGKTGVRMVPIAPHLSDELQRYIATLNGTQLFPAPRGGTTRQGGVFNDVYWSYDFHQRLKRLGIKRKNLTPYSLRHSFITRMLDEGINLYPLQNLVGHKQGSSVTAQYYHLGTKTLHKTLSKDPLSRSSQSFDERFKAFRELVREALTSYTKSVDEEKKMIMALLDNS